MVSSGNYIFPIQEDSLAAYSANERCDLAYVKNAIATKSAHFIFRRNSELLEPFNKAIRSNLGFVRRTFEKYFRLGFKTTKKKKECPNGKKTQKNNENPLSNLFLTKKVNFLILQWRLFASFENNI